MLATLLLSQGVPMLLAGDELGQTQAGNNNAYCQDNETAWIDWSSPREGLAAVADHVVNLAEAEDLPGHGDSVRVRFSDRG